MMVLVPTFRVFNEYDKEGIEAFINTLQKKKILFAIEKFSFNAIDAFNRSYTLDRVKITFSRHFTPLTVE